MKQVKPLLLGVAAALALSAGQALAEGDTAAGAKVAHRRYKPSRPDGLIRPPLWMGYSRICLSQKPCQV